MILTPIRRYGAMILMLLTRVFSSEVLAKTHTTTASQKSHLTKSSNKQVSSKQEYTRNSAKSSSLTDLRKYPSGTPRKKAFLRTVMPYITSQNAAIAAERNWLISKQYQGQWKSHLTKASNKQVSSKQEYSRNSAKSSSLPDLRKYPSGTPRKKAFLRTVMPYITSQNAAIAAERNWLISKQYQGQWSPAERARLKDIAKRYKVKWSGNTRKIPWNTLLERV